MRADIQLFCIANASSCRSRSAIQATTSTPVRVDETNQEGDANSIPTFQKAAYCYKSIPGYTGWIPGKYSENVVGSTYLRSNELAMVYFVYR